MFRSRSRSRSQTPAKTRPPPLMGCGEGDVPAGDNLAKDVDQLFERFMGVSDEVYDRYEVDTSMETVKQWVACKEEAWRREVELLNNELRAEREAREKFQFLSEDNAASLSDLSQENTKLKSDLAKLERELQFLRDEKTMVCHQLEIDQKQVDDSKKDKETLAKILESKQAAEETARKALKSELALARAQLQSTQEALKEAVMERDHHWRSMVETKRKHKAKRKAWEDESSRLLRCLETQTKVTSSHLAAISLQLAPGGSLRASLDASAGMHSAPWGAASSRQARSEAGWQGGLGSSIGGGSAASSPRSSMAAAPESVVSLPSHLPSGLGGRSTLMRESSPSALLAAASAMRAAAGGAHAPPAAYEPAHLTSMPPPPPLIRHATIPSRSSTPATTLPRSSSDVPTGAPVPCALSASPVSKGKHVTGEAGSDSAGRLHTYAVITPPVITPDPVGSAYSGHSQDVSSTGSHGKENRGAEDLSLAALACSRAQLDGDSLQLPSVLLRPHLTRATATETLAPNSGSRVSTDKAGKRSSHNSTGPPVTTVAFHPPGAGVLESRIYR